MREKGGDAQRVSFVRVGAETFEAAEDKRAQRPGFASLVLLVLHETHLRALINGRHPDANFRPRPEERDAAEARLKKYKMRVVSFFQASKGKAPAEAKEEEKSFAAQLRDEFDAALDESLASTS